MNRKLVLIFYLGGFVATLITLFLSFSMIFGVGMKVLDIEIDTLTGMFYIILFWAAAAWIAINLVDYDDIRIVKYDPTKTR